MQTNQLPIEWQQLIVAARRLNFGKMTISIANGKPVSAKVPMEKDFKFGANNASDFQETLDTIPLG